MDFWAGPATTRHADQAWELLRWLTVEPEYQTFAMGAFLFPPALTGLLGQWQATAETVAPGLRGKGLEWFVTAAEQAWTTPTPWFAYATDTAYAIDTNWFNRLAARVVEVRAAFTQADRQVNALQAQGPTLADRARRAAGGFPSKGPSVAVVPPGA